MSSKSFPIERSVSILHTDMNPTELIDKLTAKLETYPEIKSDVIYATIAAPILTQAWVTTQKGRMKNIYKYMLNYMSTFKDGSKNEKIDFEQTCLIAALLLTNRVSLLQDDKNIFLIKFYNAMDTYNMTYIKKTYLMFYDRYKIDERDPNDYSTVRLSTNTDDVYSMLTLKPLPDKILWFCLQPMSKQVMRNTEAYTEIYDYIFKQTKKSFNITKLYLYIIGKFPQQHTPEDVMAYTNQFKDSDEVNRAVRYTFSSMKTNAKGILWDAIKNLLINVVDSNITDTELTLSYMLCNRFYTRPTPHKVIRAIISFYPTATSFIQIEYKEGTVEFLKRERLAM